MKKRMELLLAVILAVVFVACGQKVPAWQEQYDLGVRYLSEGNYEEAVIAFTAAIEIDPRQEILYEQLSNAYLEMGNHNRAINILKQGYEATGSASLKELLEALQTRYLAEDWIRPEEWTVNGVPFWEASQGDVIAAFPFPGGESVWQHSPDFGALYSYSARGVHFEWDNEHDALWHMDFHSDHEYFNVIQSSRDITTKSTFDEVLRATGITEEGIVYIKQALQNRRYHLAAPIAEITNEDYVLKADAFRTDHNNLDDGDAYWFSLRYDFSSGMSLGVDFTFSAASGEFDYGYIHVRYD